MELASSTADKKGIPKLRIVYTPHPITDQPAEVCRKFLEGNDPHTGKPILGEIISSITKPLSEEEKKRGFLKRDPGPKFLPPDTADNLQQFFYGKQLYGRLSHFFSFGTSQATIMIDPVTAEQIYCYGFDSKEKLADYLAKSSTTPAWLYWQRRGRQIEMGKNGEEPYASYLKLGPNADIPESRFVRRMPMRKQDTRTESGRAFVRDTIDTNNSLEIIVVGGGTNTYWGGGDFSYMSSALVDKWR